MYTVTAPWRQTSGSESKDHGFTAGVYTRNTGPVVAPAEATPARHYRSKRPHSPPEPDSVVVPVLVVTAWVAEYQHLETVLKGGVWALQHASDLAVASRLVEEHQFVCIICDEFLADGSWTGLLPLVHEMGSAPKLIVTAGETNKQLWAEALNLGAHDVLAKPVDWVEVRYVAQHAWRAWEEHKAR